MCELRKTIRFFVRNSSPYALPKCVRAIANSRISNQRLKCDLIKFALDGIFYLAASNSFQSSLPVVKQCRGVQTETDMNMDILHAPLDVLQFTEDDDHIDTTQRINTVDMFDARLRKTLTGSN